MDSKARRLGNKRHQKRRHLKQRCTESKEGGRSVPGSRNKVTPYTEVATT